MDSPAVLGFTVKRAVRGCFIAVRNVRSFIANPAFASFRVKMAVRQCVIVDLTNRCYIDDLKVTVRCLTTICFSVGMTILCSTVDQAVRSSTALMTGSCFTF